MPGDAPARRRLTLGKSQKLRHNWEFERIRREGQRLVKGCLILNWRMAQGQNAARLGVVSSRKIGNSVGRARARRLLREVFRLHQHEIEPASELVLIARPSIAQKSSDEVEKDFVAAVAAAKLIRLKR